MIRKRLLLLLAVCLAGCKDPIDPSPLCIGVSESTVAPVSFIFDRQSCEYSASDAAAGLTIGYSVHVESDVPAVMPRPPEIARCEEPGPSGLIVHAELGDDTYRYCECDNGCPGGLAPQRTLVKGDYPDQVRLEARDHQGSEAIPAGSNVPFPPGDYDVLLTSGGTIGTGSDAVGFAIVGRYHIHLH